LAAERGLTSLEIASLRGGLDRTDILLASAEQVPSAMAGFVALDAEFHAMFVRLSKSAVLACGFRSKPDLIPG